FRYLQDLVANISRLSFARVTDITMEGDVQDALHAPSEKMHVISELLCNVLVQTWLTMSPALSIVIQLDRSKIIRLLFRGKQHCSQAQIDGLSSLLRDLTPHAAAIDLPLTMVVQTD